ncbi:MAG: D-alanine--D-alanine ligase [Eubacterium sp.]|nr:D-alanine--D-alanine ligase [Eubacterium sp.]
MKWNIAVMFGGGSVEHEVSVISGIQAIMHLDKEKYNVVPVYITKDSEMYAGPDVGNIEAYRDIPGLLKRSQRVFFFREAGEVYLLPYPVKRKTKGTRIDLVLPVVHGKKVEDGTLAGYLRMLGVPFVGCDVGASALGMDKYASKVVLREAGVPVLDGICFNTADYADIDSIVEKTEARLGYPVIVKPVDLGSSVGISVARDRAQLIEAIDDAFTYAHIILIEHAIMQLREINCAVLGGDGNAIASECEEPLHTDEILSYKDKYQSGGSKSGGSKGMAGVSRKIPAELTPEQREEIRQLAVRGFQALGCNGVARIDFMIDEETGKLYFNEINTIPGSLAFYLWEPLGIEYPELLDRMVALAMKRVREEEATTFSFDSNLLDKGALGAKGSKK